MKCRKTIFMAGVFVCLIILFSGCSAGLSENTLSYDYNGIHVEVDTIKPLSEPNVTEYQWIDISEINPNEKFDLVAKGTISSTQEISMTYDYEGVKNICYGTILEVELNKIYLEDDHSVDRVTVYYELSSYDVAEEVQLPCTGETYYFFLEKTEGNERNYLGYEKLADYFISLPPIYMLTDTDVPSKDLLNMFLQGETDSSQINCINDDYDTLDGLLTDFYKKR